MQNFGHAISILGTNLSINEPGLQSIFVITLLTSKGCVPFIYLVADSLYATMVQLPDSFKDFAVDKMGSRGISQHLHTHCRREAFHAQWSILLDNEFLEACQHGIGIECYDGLQRRFYPKILTYSADYPEKYDIHLLPISQSAELFTEFL